MNTEDVKDWVTEHTVRKSKIFKMVVHGNEGKPCMTNNGEICVFPFVFPDCSISPPSNMCQTQDNVEAISFSECTTHGHDKLWCSIATYKNNSHKPGGKNWGNCSPYCSDKRRIKENLAEVKFKEFWEEHLFRLVTDDIGLCYTYNPKHQSSTGPEEKFIALLGRLMSSTLPTCKQNER